MEKTFRFLSPINGDCLFETDGRQKDGTLYVNFRMMSDTPVTVNGISAQKNGEFYDVELPISLGKNIITAKAEMLTEQITVFGMRDKKYCRLSSDDNIIFLWDINKNKDNYSSIFDNPYLAVYKKAHDLYGITCHLNIYYEMPKNCAGFMEIREDFDLSMMTDKFKSEWQQNSDWLKLNFHANGDKPDRPYKSADYLTVYNDCKKVQSEIIRFAGEDTLSKETTVHWGECTKAGVLALSELGIKSLAGYFTFYKDEPLVSYFYKRPLVEHIENRDFWYDTELGILYGKIDLVLNDRKVRDNVTECLDRLKSHPTQSRYVEVMIHEQYFYSDYAHYLESFEDIVLDACSWLKANGYTPVFIDEIL